MSPYEKAVMTLALCLLRLGEAFLTFYKHTPPPNKKFNDFANTLQLVLTDTFTAIKDLM